MIADLFGDIRFYSHMNAFLVELFYKKYFYIRVCDNANERDD